MNKTLLAGALLAMSAWTTGAASAPPRPVTVTLSGNQIQVDQDPIVVQKQMGPNVPIRWQLPPGADYRFDPTGIVVNGEQTRSGLKPGQDQLQNPCPSASPNHVTCINRNSRPGRFKYTIRLRDRSQNLIELDPIIVNQ